MLPMSSVEEFLLFITTSPSWHPESAESIHLLPRGRTEGTGSVLALPSPFLLYHLCGAHCPA